MNVYCLIDNLSLSKTLFSEHAFSLYIEHQNAKILFDVGKSDLFYQNALSLGIDLSTIDKVVLSHPHYDHVGGLMYFLQRNSQAKIYLNNDFFCDTYFKFLCFEKNLTCKFIINSQNQDRFLITENSDILQIDTNIFIIKNFPRHHPLPQDFPHFYIRDSKNILIQDSFSYEQILVIRTSSGLVLFTGCSHNGILNILEKVSSLFPSEKINSIIGGLHLKPTLSFDYFNNSKYVASIANKLQESTVQKIYANHCTTKKSCDLLGSILGSKIHYFSAGSKIIL